MKQSPIMEKDLRGAVDRSLNSFSFYLAFTFMPIGRANQHISQLRENARFDGINHWPLDSDITAGVCPVCKHRTKIRCEKCDVALHVHCFKSFHQH